MKPDLLKLLLDSQPTAALPGYLEQTPLDEMAEIDMRADTYRNLAHANKNYWMPVPEGTYSAMYRHVCDHLVWPEDREAHAALMMPEGMEERLRSAPRPGLLQAEIRMRRLDGVWRRTRLLLLGGKEAGLEEGKARLFVYGCGEAGERKEEQPRMDGLTGLLVEKDFFEQAQEKRRQARGAWCLLSVRISNFRLLVDWNGSEKILYVLARFGAVLSRRAESAGGLAGYRGKDDFCMMLPFDMGAIEQMYAELKDLVDSASQTVGFTPVVGVCVTEDPGESVLDVFNRAAMTADEIGTGVKKRIRLYDGELRRRSSEEYQLLKEFRRAMENGEISFWLQPQCLVSNRRIVGAETLARWRRADGSWTSPSVFVPVLERHGIVTNLDLFIWDSVCKWLRSLLDRGFDPVPVSVNVSPVDLLTMDVPAHMSGLIRQYALTAELLKIEITESAYAGDPTAVRAAVKRLRDMGFLVLMDDFGSGNSSLNMLSSLNVDVIKLDAQFLNISKRQERKGISILESVINMAKTLSTPVIMEGVENQEQAAFLTDLGCRYMQGFYFYKPMPPEEYEKLIAGGGNTDHRGFRVKTNQEMHVREFLDENVFSDAMLNKILGPVAFYNWHGDQVDIVRYNQQFYLMVGIELEALNRRLHGMQAFVYPEDRERFFRTLEQAVSDRMNGAKGVIRVYKPNGVLCWIRVHVYFMGEDDRGKKFYASAEDVTELQYLNADIPGGYFRCGTGENFDFQYISDYFLRMTGFTREEIRDRFGDQLIRMVHPLDRQRLRQDAAATRETGCSCIRPYRLLRKSGDYLYVAEQSQLTDQFGTPCWQSMAVDVTEVMKLRNQMRLLARFSSDSIIFTRRGESGLQRELVVHGLEARCGVSREEMEKALNDESFYRWTEGGKTFSPAALRRFFETHTGAFETEFMLHPPNGHHIRLYMKTDRVTDETMGVEYITVLREI